jgi:DNA-binding NtrC family response regulator
MRADSVGRDPTDLRPAWEPDAENIPRRIDAVKQCESLPPSVFPMQESCDAQFKAGTGIQKLNRSPRTGPSYNQPDRPHHQGGIGLAPIRHCCSLWQFGIMNVRPSLPLSEAINPRTAIPPVSRESATMIRIGLYSEDRTLYPLLSSALGKEFQVLLESDENGMVELLSGDLCDVMILDLHSNHGSLQERIGCSRRLIAFQVPSLIMADDGLRSTAFEMVRMGAFGYCRRPPSIRDLKTMLSRAFENSLLKHQLQSVQQRLEIPVSCDGMIGSSSPMQRVYQLVNRVADLNASVLVTGESGTGKELVARAIHNIGSRRNRPFVAVSCGAIPETLIEAELFGHEKGAFTGTVGAREGYFEQAADGTLFLDEIGDLSLFTQVKLLRVLQQMEFSRLGSNRLIPLRARLIFATHQDLGKLVAEGKFRQDLYYRINVMRIDSPSLQDRAEDIPRLATHFLRHYSQMFQKPMENIAPDALAMLQSYPWPGNVRELENVIQRAIILSTGDSIRVEDLPLNAQEESGADLGDVVDIGEYQPSGSFERQLRDYKIKLAVNAVRDHNGNKTMAARSLAISRAYLHRLLRLAEVDPQFDQDLREQVSA